jgi:hypothetical protein
MRDLITSCTVALLTSGALFCSQATGDEGYEDMRAEMSRLRSETQSLRAEVEWLRDNPVRLPAVEATPVSTAPAAPPPAAEDEEYFTLDELKSEMKKLAWSKGDFRIVPYGYLWADMFYETERVYPTGYTLWVLSAENNGEDAFVVDARRTRLGFDVEGPMIPFLNCAKSGGRVEIDFFGNFATTENRPGVLLRHAYWEAKTDYFAVLVGQTWDVISPLYPGVFNYSVGWDAGNIGYRRAQFRYDRYIHLSPTLLLTTQFSLNQNVNPDLANEAGVVREPTGWPIIEGRVATTLGPRGPGYHPMEVGVSGHVGNTGFDFNSAGPPPLNLPPARDVRFLTWSFNIDVRVPLTDRLGVQGEFFTGQDLSPFLGGIGQGVCPCSRRAIRATGGWLDVWYDLTPRWHVHAGYSIDDPNNDDFLVGRTYNQFFFGNIGFDITPKLFSGLEVSSWKTLYQDRRAGLIPNNQLGPRRPGESVTFEWMVRYGF